MERMTRGRTLLIELLLTALFLAVSAPIIARLFLIAHATAAESRLTNRATAEAQNWAERLVAADDWESLLLDQGFGATEAGYLLETGGGLLLKISLTEIKTDQGRLMNADISAMSGDDVLIEIPQKRYVAD